MLNKPIYALSGYAEWFWLMAKNWKDIENRPWSLSNKRMNSVGLTLPTRIYLHASKTPASDEEIEFILDTVEDGQSAKFCVVDWDDLRGKIIGEITITGEVTKSDSKWFFGKYGFLVKDGILYDKPIPCRGALGFFRPDIK